MNKKLIFGASAILCLAAVFPLPYGFYNFLRFAITITSVLAAIELIKENNFIWVLFGGIAILFNPIIPIHLTKDIWFVIDLIVAGAFGWRAFRDE